MAVETKRKRLGEILVEAGLVDSEAVDEAVKRQQATGSPIGEILLDQGLISSEDLAAALSFQLDTALVNLGWANSDRVSAPSRRFSIPNPA